MLQLFTVATIFISSRLRALRSVDGQPFHNPIREGKGSRPYWSYREPARIEIPSLPDWRKTRLLDVQCGPLGNSKWKSLLEIQHYPISETACRQTETSTVGLLFSGKF